MQRISVWIPSLFLLCLLWNCQASRVLQASTAVDQSAFECGKPLGPCGSAIPAGVSCTKGPGYCQPGYFCGWENNTKEPSRCLPIPANCGKAGSPCCPSNADSPNTSNDDKLNRKPFCKDGSTCFYFAPMPGLDNGDIYAGNKGNGACTAIPADCGTGPGSPCCPMPYHVDSNPKLQRYGCPDNQFCNYDNSTTGALPSGTCKPNPSDCGQFGKKCCIFTGGAATGMRCGAQYGQSGPKGYCANPVGYKGTNHAPLKDLVCTQCPDALDPSLEKSNPNWYFACKKWS